MHSMPGHSVFYVNRMNEHAEVDELIATFGDDVKGRQYLNYLRGQSPEHARIAELTGELERLQKLTDDFRAWPPRVCDRCKKVAIGFPFDGSSTADPGYHHGDQRLCQTCYYEGVVAVEVPA